MDSDILGPIYVIAVFAIVAAVAIWRRKKQ